MRLICPRCGAQYEVDDSVIPASGRDVQCSGCGQTWFQPSAQMIEAEEARHEDRRDAPEGWDVAEPSAPPPEVAQSPAPDAEAAIAAAVAATLREAGLPPAAPAAAPPPDGPPAEDDPSGLGAAPKAGAVPRRPLDEALLAILREEAAREAAARQAEGSTLETQEEMNLEAVSPPPKAPPFAGKPASAPPAASGRAPPVRNVLDFSDLSADAEEEPAELGSDLTTDLTADLTERPDTAEPRGARRRRQRLPDIEEINSTLRASVDRGHDPAALGTPQYRAKAQSGFRRGFSGVMLVALALVGLYVLAPRLAVAVPALAPALEAYVGAANNGRIWLDQLLQSVILQLQAPPPGA